MGNSQGVRLPKAILALSGIENDIEISVTKSGITIRPVKKVRVGWLESFREMAACGDNFLLDNPVLTEWDQKEWEWK